jgi:hypothetical protein
MWKWYRNVFQWNTSNALRFLESSIDRKQDRLQLWESVMPESQGSIRLLPLIRFFNVKQTSATVSLLSAAIKESWCVWVSLIQFSIQRASCSQRKLILIKVYCNQLEGRIFCWKTHTQLFILLQECWDTISKHRGVNIGGIFRIYLLFRKVAVTKRYFSVQSTQMNLLKKIIIFSSFHAIQYRRIS